MENGDSFFVSKVIVDQTNGWKSAYGTMNQVCYDHSYAVLQLSVYNVQNIAKMLFDLFTEKSQQIIFWYLLMYIYFQIQPYSTVVLYIRDDGGWWAQSKKINLKLSSGTIHSHLIVQLVKHNQVSSKQPVWSTIIKFLQNFENNLMCLVKLGRKLATTTAWLLYSSLQQPLLLSRAAMSR